MLVYEFVVVIKLLTRPWTKQVAVSFLSPPEYCALGLGLFTICLVPEINLTFLSARIRNIPGQLYVRAH